MKNSIKLTMAQALLRFMSQQYIKIDDHETAFVHGIFTIFGHGNVTGLGEALEFDNYGLKTYRGTNEQGMAHVATSYAKQLNRLGIMPCTSSIGPGALNMVTAAGVATSNRIPLLLLPGDVFADRQPDPVLQQIEQPHDYTISANDAFKPVSKYWDRITRPEQLMTACINAFRVLTCPAQTGAVTLCLPQDVQTESYSYPEQFFKKRVWQVERPQASELKITEVAALLRQASCPIIICGGGVHYSLATATLTAFANKHQIAVTETQAGKSALSWDEPMNLGGLGTTGTMAANKLARKADVILAIGTRLQDFTTASKWLYPDATIIQININAFDAFKIDALAVTADAKTTLQQLSRSLADYKTAASYQHMVTNLKQVWAQELDRVTKATTTNKQLAQKQLAQTEVLGILNEHMQAGDTVICAAGSLPGDLHRLWRSKTVKDYHVEYGFSCMGYEVAAGLGVTMAKEQAGAAGEAYVVVGDGSFLMLHSELVTAIQEQKKFTILLFDNSGFQCIHNLQTSLGSNGFCTELRYRDHKQELNGKTLNIDFAAYAAALGATVYAAKNAKELKAALTSARGGSNPVVIAMKVTAKSMSDGYDSWWRVGVADCSKSAKVNTAYRAMQLEREKTREY